MACPTGALSADRPGGHFYISRPRASSFKWRKEEDPRRKRILDHVIPPKLGFGLVVKKGQNLRIIDIEGKQVVDMALFNADNPREKLSTSNSRTRYVPKPGAEYVPRDKLTEGDTLMSTLCRPMMTFVRETPDPKGVHDTHNRMCNRFLCGGDVRATARGHPGHHGPLHELPPRLRAGALGNRRAGSRSTPCNEAPTTQPFTTSGRRPAPRGRPSPGAGSP